jgi:energy-coupling factor transporter ATP-binding protein EcfA2
MAIEIRDFPEPLSESALALSADPVLIKSDAYRQLLHELRRYCDLEASGRSFLIAGHRGSGKTTLVLSAFEQILRESSKNNTELKPLMVPLLGPSLLPDPEEETSSPPKGATAVEKEKVTEGAPLPSTDGAATEEKKLTGFENVLVQITLGLHRAVVREFTEAFRERMVKTAVSLQQGGRKKIDPQFLNALLEAPGQLALELDENPGKARLREFWLRAGALPRGLLSRRPAPNQQPGSASDPAWSDQGVRELVALCSVSEAYRRISGTIQAKQEAKAGAQDSISRTREIELKSKELFGPLITLLTGGAVATGVAAFNPGQIGIAIGAGVLTALGAALVTKYSTSRSLQRSATQEDLFIPNLTVATLDRILPVLLERIRDAGLAPIFVIDELDKVDNLSERIPQMVKRLKKLVAESAFFCFLTDRRYFEEMRWRDLNTPYSIEYTYFTNQLFVAFRHTDFHDYLAQLIPKPQPPKSSGTASAEETISREEIADHAVLPYIVLHAAQLHPIDLRREVGAIRDPEGRVSLPLGSVRSIPSRRLETLIQVAIELLLENQKMDWELDQDPAFRRLAHDALYFISRRWRRGNTQDLRFDGKALDAFTAYLSDRMKTELPNARPSAPGSAGIGNGQAPQDLGSSGNKGEAVEQSVRTVVHNAEGATLEEKGNTVFQPSFTPRQAEFLWGLVRQLADLLAEPKNVRELALERQQDLAAKNPSGNPRFAAQVLDAIRFTDPGPLLERSPDSPDIFKWRYDRSGRPLVEAPAQDKPKAIQADAVSPVAGIANPNVDLIETFNAALLDLTENTIDCGKLGTRFGVIPQSPAWPSVQPAMERLKKTNTPSGNPTETADISIVGQFADLLRRRADTIGLSICCGWVIGKWKSKNDEERVFAGLQTLSDALRLPELHEEEVVARIQKFSNDVLRQFSKQAPFPVPLDGAATVQTWRQAVDAIILEAGPSKLLVQDVGDQAHEAWDYWRQRLQERDAIPNRQAIICAVSRKGPSQYLRFPPEEMTAREWSRAFYEIALKAFPVGSQPTSPPVTEAPPDPVAMSQWLAIVALQRLGFGANLYYAGHQASALFKFDVLSVPEVRTFSPSIGLLPSVLIVSEKEAVSEDWKPAKDCPALVLRAYELQKLRLSDKDREELLMWLQPRCLVFDWSAQARVRSRKTSEQAEDVWVKNLGGDKAVREIISLWGPKGPRPLVFAILPQGWKGRLEPPFLSIGPFASMEELATAVSREESQNLPS